MTCHALPINHCFGAALLATALAGCAVAPLERPATGAEAQCLDAFERVDQAVEEEGVGDGMAARVAGFPYLRASRFLASYARDDLAGAQFDQWLGRMKALARQAHRIELANLPAARRGELGRELEDIGLRHGSPRDALEACAELLAAADRARPERRAALQSAVIVPDDYATWQRIVGLYWLTRIPFANGVRDWHRDVHETFARPLDALPVTGRLAAYSPPPGARPRIEVAALLARASANPLAIPEPAGDDLEALYRAHAPVFVVDTKGAADIPGALGWAEDGLPGVVSRLPVVYRRISHARYQGRALLQLNYAIWFPERPLDAGWDILGGRLDGVLWRVTLAPDGEPWVFDTIHHCGCYHQFFPTPRAGLRPQPDTLDEPALVPQMLPRVGPATRIALRLAAGTHYLQRVIPDAGAAGKAQEYGFVDDDALRSIALKKGGRRSVFRPDGIVPGTERGERWLFWPMGVPDPGAQRQWGRHATAFVGRRHFDDPGLLERYFSLESVDRE
ncbi:MAG TPA: hypothetical protein VLD15_04450 [Burkholderiales bacterium]|nr:hypothetical protein [Burkholderiales bacterium]